MAAGGSQSRLRGSQEIRRPTAGRRATSSRDLEARLGVCGSTRAAGTLKEGANGVGGLNGELAMPGGRTASKQSGKPSWQLLFSEALRHQRALPTEEPPLIPPSSMAETMQGAAMDRILQEFSAVGCKLEGMDSAMASLTEETKSMRLDIAGFQSQVTGLDQRVTSVETHIASWVDRDQ
ncbi:hypothetical protein NDU88_002023 [Pleurodeles waltl]|uniref:Uncharacterized protein n=1 Tax=Pleurodeles waltl TaxID=8319 RepID=A0AAV7TKU3_PLEWA|nr:hypothetical protein NDU88_002023 [Pleurodeles waltl]